ncbi:TMV resistance protein N-like [Senna tora]|uniref:TMV resistance protein N-like n=1 Tax=Senna tora TaxID=362788 RepID=A0A834WZZ3_9FABA|nr:TMV resistance protein N-like [Senna tora]
MEGSPNFFSEDSPLALEWEGSNADRVRKQMLIGKLLTDKPLNHNTVKSMIAKGWGLMQGLNIAEVSQNLFIFTFDKADDCDRVVRDGPWAVLGKTITVEDSIVDEKIARSFMRAKDRYGPWARTAPVKAIHRVILVGVNGEWKVDCSVNSEEREASQDGEVHDRASNDDSVSSGMALGGWALEISLGSCVTSLEGLEDIKVDSVKVMSPLPIKIEDKPESHGPSTVQPYEEVFVGTCLALVLVNPKLYEEKLSNVLQNVCLKRKASKELSPDKIKMSQNRAIVGVLQQEKFSIGVSPPKGSKQKGSPNRRRKKLGRNVWRCLDNLVEIPIGDGGCLSSMEIFNFEGLGGWPETAPKGHECFLMECSRAWGTLNIKSTENFNFENQAPPSFPHGN